MGDPKQRVWRRFVDINNDDERLSFTSTNEYVTDKTIGGWDHLVFSIELYQKLLAGKSCWVTLES